MHINLSGGCGQKAESAGVSRPPDFYFGVNAGHVQRGCAVTAVMPERIKEEKYHERISIKKLRKH